MNCLLQVLIFSYSRCHLPTLYIGMEYMRTNSFKLAEQVTYSSVNHLLVAVCDLDFGPEMWNNPHLYHHTREALNFGGTFISRVSTLSLTHQVSKTILYIKWLYISHLKTTDSVTWYFVLSFYKSTDIASLLFSFLCRRRPLAHQIH